MKKRIATTLCALTLSSLLMMLTVGPVMAAEPGYEHISYQTVVMPTIDGMWTSPDEWTDTDVTWIGTSIAFRSTWYYGDDVLTQWIVEFFTDTTDNPGDYWQFCIDGSQSGGSAPQVGQHRMFMITGHDTIEWFMGDGSGWGDVTYDPSEIEWVNSLSASPMNSTPHWILEFQIPKNTGTVQMGMLWNFLLGAFDASNPGFHAWPPTDPDVPDEWGIENYTSEPIPEGLTFAVMVLLSSISMLVGYKYFVKQKETKAQ
jgi:hypothetical protein